MNVPKIETEEPDVEGWILAVVTVGFIVLFLASTTDSWQWVRHAQDIMSITASNYDVTKLATGQAVAGLAFALALLAAGPTILASLRSSLPILSITLAYGIMMFASSYVEEEQHFWYWSATAWLMLLWIKWYISPFPKNVCSSLCRQCPQTSTQSSTTGPQFSYRSDHDANSSTLEPNGPKICRRARHSTNISILPPTHSLDSRRIHISMDHSISCEQGVSAFPSNFCCCPSYHDCYHLSHFQASFHPRRFSRAFSWPCKSYGFDR